MAGIAVRVLLPPRVADVDDRLPSFRLPTCKPPVQWHDNIHLLDHSSRAMRKLPHAVFLFATSWSNCWPRSRLGYARSGS